MSRSLGIVMDPIGAISPYKDTSLALLLAAQGRGWQLHYMTLTDLALSDGRALAQTRPLSVSDDSHCWYQLGEPGTRALGSLDAILMRKEPPVDSNYIYATHVLEAAERAGTVVANSPAGLRDAQEKLFTSHFPDCCAPSLVAAQPAMLRAFIHDQGTAVLKPLDGMGGESVFVVRAGDPNASVIIETLTERGGRYIMAQRYVPEISSGDKRVLMIDGEPAPYALARVPPEGETRGNLAAGGMGHAVPLSERDRWISEQVAPALEKRGLWFVGLDIIGSYLTEINFTSPTCLREIEHATGDPIAEKIIAGIEARLEAG